jgi:hypothetical protein
MLPPLEHDYSHRFKQPAKSTPAYEVRNRVMEMMLEALKKNAGFIIPEVRGREGWRGGGGRGMEGRGRERDGGEGGREGGREGGTDGWTDVYWLDGGESVNPQVTFNLVH